MGILVDVEMMFLGISGREIRDTQLAFIGYGFLIAVVSLVVAGFSYKKSMDKK